MKRRWGAVVAVLALVATAAVLPWRVTPSAAQMGPGMGPGTGQPLDQLSGDAFDRAFLMQMSMHHAMAVMMARPVAANGQHQELRDVAGQMIADQTREIGQMRAWARDWYGVDLPDMLAMMDGSGGHMPMGHGPMGQAGGMPMHQMEMSMLGDLWRLPANRLEAVFMSLMIPHHDGAIGMANLALERAAHQELKDLASQIVASQTAENQQMNAWLATWYGL